MLPKKIIKAFTLAELIIVMVIVWILSTIWFTTFKNYIVWARDSNRVATMKNIETWLNIFQIQTSKYPKPEWSNVYTWWLILWWEEIIYSYLWEIWEEISRQIKITTPPVDPKTGNKYIYATNFTQDKYQIWWITEDLEASLLFVKKAYASQNTKAKVIWNHQVNIKVPSSNKVWLVTVPSMIFDTWTWSNILNTWSTYHIVNWWKNLPFLLNSSQTIDREIWNNIIKKIRDNTKAEIVTLDITSVVNSWTWNLQTELEKVFWTAWWKTKEDSEKILASIWLQQSWQPDLNAIATIVTWNQVNYINTINNNQWDVSLWTWITYNNWFYKSITNNWIVYQVSSLSSWAKEWTFTSISPQYTLKESFNVVISWTQISSITPTWSFEGTYSTPVTLLNWTIINQITYKLPDRTIVINWQTYNLTTPLVNWINTYSYTWSNSQINVTYNSTNKTITWLNIWCNSWYVNNSWTCVADICNWNAPTFSTTNWTQKFNTNWTHNTTPWFCTFVCQSWYYWNGAQCTAASIWNYVSTSWLTTQTACTNKPSNSTYTASSWLTTNTCPWSCNSWYWLSSWTSCLIIPSQPWTSSASSITTSSITWNWQTTTNTTRYEFSTNNSTWNNVWNVITYTENSWISCWTSYTRYVRACNNDVCGSSTTLSATSWSCQSNPTNLTLSHITRNKTFTFSLTAWVWNWWSCKLQYYRNGTTWTNISETTYNCDSNISNQSVTLPWDWWNNSWSSIQVRIIRTSDSVSLWTFWQNLNCSTTSGSSSSTPNIDEDCNWTWNNSTTSSYQTCTTGISVTIDIYSLDGCSWTIVDTHYQCYSPSWWYTNWCWTPSHPKMYWTIWWNCDICETQNETLYN